MAQSKHIYSREQLGACSSTPGYDEEVSKHISQIFNEISTQCVRHDEDDGFIDTYSENNEAPATNSTVNCAKCVSHERVQWVSQLKRGLHIATPGKQVGHTYNFSTREQKWVYMHHAIVKEVIALDETRAIADVKLIHMWENDEGKLGLCESVITFALANDELYIVAYKHPRYTPDEIVDRAEKALNDRETARFESKKKRFSKYHLVTTNCEHFATWCVVGQSKTQEDLHWLKAPVQKFLDLGDSAQVMEIKAALSEVFGNGGMIPKFLGKFLHESSDEIAKFVNVGMPSSNTVLVGAAAMYILYCLIMTLYFHVKYTRKEICESCYRGNIANIWARCSIYGVTSVATYFIMNGCVSIPAVTSCFALIVLSIVGQHYIPNIRKALMAPNECSKKAIYRLEEINVGDIVTLTYWGLPHDVIVTEVHTGGKGKTGKIRAVHYALEKLFSTREVKEEYFTFALNSGKWAILKRHKCEHLNLFEPEIAVLRARQRIGERKWHATRNRSDHVCFWAKVKPQLTDEDNEHELPKPTEGVQGQSPHLSSLLIGEFDVHLSTDIEIGDAVRVKGKEGIVVKNDSGEREMKLHLITAEGSVKKLKYFINLNTDRVTLIRYHPAHCHPQSVRAERAGLIRGQRIPMKNFMDFCLLLKG